MVFSTSAELQGLARALEIIDNSSIYLAVVALDSLGALQKTEKILNRPPSQYDHEEITELTEIWQVDHETMGTCARRDPGKRDGRIPS